MIGKVYKKRPANRADYIVDVLAVVAKVMVSIVTVNALAYLLAEFLAG